MHNHNRCSCTNLLIAQQRRADRLADALDLAYALLLGFAAFVCLLTAGGTA